MNNVHNAFVTAQKRRLSESECKQSDAPLPMQGQVQEQPESKQRRRDQQQDYEEQQHHEHNLLSFCDELLFEIFKYLDSSSIMALMHCSPRFESLLLDHRFWHNIDLSNAPLPLGILEEILGRATEKTHTIKICGPPSSQHVAGEFKQFTCTLTSVFPKVSTHLQILELQGVSLDFEYIHISEFPASLKRLTLKDCSVKVGDHVKSIFHTIEKQLVVLEDLSIEDNNWFEPYYIMALSKLPALRRLSLKGCQMMCKFVPYGSMAARFGFTKLEVLDLRLTPISNGDLQCFSAVETLKELLLESPPNLQQVEPVPAKTCNGSGKEEPAPTQPDPHKILSDDEPSTSRAAMEHLRAINLAKSKENSTCFPKNHFVSEHFSVEERRDGSDARGTLNSTAMRIGCNIESDDEDTSSTSASSSDKSDSAAAQSNGQSSDANASVQPNLVVIALPSVVRERLPPSALNDVNLENPAEPAAAAGVPGPCVYMYSRPLGFPPTDSDIRIMQQIHGNNPAHSRFLPRRDQVIFMNPQPMGEPSGWIRRQRIHRPNFDQVVQHPMFWNVLDPLDRDYTRRLRSSRQLPQTITPQNYISDRAVYSFGRAANPVQPDVVFIRNLNRSANIRLERITLRDYPHITNYTLEHLVQCSPNLIYIDVSGTSVSMLGVRTFQKLKPNCEVIATHLTAREEQPQKEQEQDAEQEPEQEDEQLPELEEETEEDAKSDEETEKTNCINNDNDQQEPPSTPPPPQSPSAPPADENHLVPHA